jgi:hypothetical protein
MRWMDKERESVCVCVYMYMMKREREEIMDDRELGEIPLTQICIA